MIAEIVIESVEVLSERCGVSSLGYDHPSIYYSDHHTVV